MSVSPPVRSSGPPTVGRGLLTYSPAPFLPCLDLATLFYEWGWGQSFHFANRHKDETFAQSIKRHEYYLASRLVSE